MRRREYNTTISSEGKKVSEIGDLEYFLMMRKPKWSETILIIIGSTIEIEAYLWNPKCKMKHTNNESFSESSRQ
jgi:hypothetical protein